MKKILFIAILGILLVGNVYAADQWDKTDPAGTESPSDLDTLIIANNAALDRLLFGYREDCDLAYSSASAVTVAAGQIGMPNSARSIVRWRENTSSTTVTFSNIDTGSEAAGTWYVYAVADTDATTFTCEVSLSSSAPTGATYYQRLGYFTNDSSLDIDSDSVVDDSGISLTDGSVSTAKLAALAVTNAKIAATTIDLTTKVTGLLPAANLATVTLAKGGTSATTAAGAFTNIVAPKVYDSDWFAVSTGTAYLKTHNLGTTNLQITLYFSTTSDGSSNVDVDIFQFADTSNLRGGSIQDITTTTLNVQTGQHGVHNGFATNGTIESFTSGYYRVIAIALE